MLRKKNRAGAWREVTWVLISNYNNKNSMAKQSMAKDT